jgi:hypothetical protein
MGQGYFMVCLMAHMPYMHIENDDGKMVETSRGSSISRSPTWVAWHLRRDSAWAIWRSLIFRDSQNAQASWSVYIYTHSMECAPLSPYVQFDSLSTPEWVFLRTTGWSSHWVTDKVWLLSLVDWIPQDPIADWANLDELPRVCGWIFSWLYNSIFSFKIVIPRSETYFICQKVYIYIYTHSIPFDRPYASCGDSLNN